MLIKKLRYFLAFINKNRGYKKYQSPPISVAPEAIAAPGTIESDGDECRWWMKGEIDEGHQHKKHQSPNHEIVLFEKHPDDEDEHRSWLTTAKRRSDGSLYIVRGDGRTGISFSVAHREVAALCKALLREFPHFVRNKSKNDVMVLLEIFAKKFHDKEGDPFGYIVDLIRKNEIKHEMEHW